MKLTIFTPTFNRESLLPRLYKSLVDQTNTNFVWLIVDDGSTDNTENIINKWISDQKIQIRYYKQKNSGKSMAHNYGVSLTDTDLFACVDSDDFLDRNAIDIILKKWEHSNENHIGIACLKKNIDNGINFPEFQNFISESTLRDMYDKYKYKGELMLIYKTEIIKKYRFPKFKGEKFVPETYLYDLLDQEGNLLILKKNLYYYEYIDDGYTRNMAKLIVENHNGYLAFITQRLKNDKALKQKIGDTIRYIAIKFTFNKRRTIKESQYPILTILMYPVGFLLYIKKYKL